MAILAFRGSDGVEVDQVVEPREVVGVAGEERQSAPECARGQEEVGIKVPQRVHEHDKVFLVT